jgi:predicted PurR-regulated permease PerM
VLGLDRHTARYTWTVVFILLLMGVVYLIRETLLIFGVSLLFAYLLWPLVKFLDRRLPGRSKVWALAIVYLSLVALLIVIGVSIGSRIVAQATALTTEVPGLISKIHQPAQPVASSPLQTLRNRVLSTLGKQLSDHSQDLVSLLPNAILGILSHVGSLIFIVLVPILSFFFLKDGEAIQSSILGIVPAGPRRDSINDVAAELNVLFAQYMRALVLLVVAAFLAYGLFFSLIGIPYGILLAAIASPLEFIPMVGPLTAAIVILAVAGLGGFHHLLWIVAFLATFRIFQDYVLSPHLLSEGMELHPLLVIFGVLAGASIAGISGSFLSVPVLATLRVIFRQLQKRPCDPSAQSLENGLDHETSNTVRRL